MNEDIERLIKLLNEDLGLTPYESRAYIAILLHGPLSPGGVNQKSGIPRPRTYDVLNSLVGKGLLVERPGRPRMYVAVDPRVGLEKLVTDLKRKMLRELEEKKKIADTLISILAKHHDRNRKIGVIEERVWVTKRDRALIAMYSEAIRNIKEEVVIASSATIPPEKEILNAVKQALKKKKIVRVIRPTIFQLTGEEAKEYEELIKLGVQIKYLDYEGLTFAVFDRKETVLWMPPYPSQFTVWINLPALAVILYNHFEELWEKGEVKIQD